MNQTMRRGWQKVPMLVERKVCNRMGRHCVSHPYACMYGCICILAEAYVMIAPCPLLCALPGPLTVCTRGSDARSSVGA